MRRFAVLLCCAGSALVMWGAGSARAADQSAAALAPVASPVPDMLPWVPSESWAGGRQYDSRLERRVRFWGTGMPLREVFDGVKEQTEVEIGFWPAGDVNERICVTLYLNPEQPPTLRELMAQLSWVTDCGFGYAAESGGDREARYYLMSTSIGQGAMEKLHEERAAASAAREEERLSAVRDLRDRVLAAVEECRSAVGLSQGELVRRYRGENDVLLLALLDPERRAGMEFALSVPRAKRESIPRERPWALNWKWCELTREQRDAIGVALGIREEEACWDDGELTNAAGGAGHDLRVGLSVLEDVVPFQEGLGMIAVWREGPLAEDPRQRRAVIPLLRWPGTPASGETDLKIRQLLGESITQEEIEQAAWSHEEAVRQQEEADALEAAQHAMTEHRALSEEAEERLAGLRASVPRRTAYSLWQVQEAAAAASGMHVVSDCFWQAEQSIDSMLECLPRGDTSGLSMLDVLTLRCGSVEGVDPLRRVAEEWWTAEGEWTAAQEWGDAGEFLRFRSLGRAAWREAFLPEAVLSAADSQLEPVLDESGEAGREVRAPVSVRNLARIMAMTTEPQQHVGGWVIYGDPTDAGNAYRRPYLSRLLRLVSDRRGMLGTLAALSDEEWGSVEGEGLHDVTIELRQDGEGLRHLTIDPRGDGERLYVRFDVVRLVPSSMCPTPEMADWWAEKRAREESLGLEPGSWETPEETVLYMAGEGRRSVTTFPTVLRVRRTSTERLVEGGSGAEPE